LQDKELSQIRRETDDMDLHAEGGNIQEAREPTWGKGAHGLGPNSLSFALAANRAIYSPLTEGHAEKISSSAAEKQRREGHHLGEERVELVD
jgi:hypothetical protein